MHELTIIRQNGGTYIDSREVAELIGKRHDHLLRDIGKYSETMRKSTAPKIGVSDFFFASTYFDSTGRELPCYLLSKMGCELVANKLTGEKGVLFTAAYVSKFNEMEQIERAEREELLTIPVPRLGEINACVRIIVRELKSVSATPGQIMAFLQDIYEPFGITLTINTPNGKEVQRWYTAGEIAKECGVYSFTGRPHSQAVGCILNEIIFIGEEHKCAVAANYGDFSGVSVRYNSYALRDVMQWLVENEWPEEIYGFERTYYVQYQD